MNTLELNILYTAIALISVIVLRLAFAQSVKKVSKKLGMSKARKKIILKVSNIVLFLLFCAVLAMIWRIKREDFLIFLSSTLAVLGIAFFAQWSILSNVTAAFILFFNHPMKIGNVIKIYDKDFPVEGEITDITAFFIYIKTSEGTELSIPNSMALQKSISIVKR